MLNRELKGAASAVRSALLSAAEELAAPMPPTCVDVLAQVALQGAPGPGGADAPGAGKEKALALQVGDTVVPGCARDVVDKLRLPVSSFEVREVHLCAVPPQVHRMLAASERVDYADCRAFSFSFGGIVLTYGTTATVGLAEGVSDAKTAAVKEGAASDFFTTPAAAIAAMARAGDGAPPGADGGADGAASSESGARAAAAAGPSVAGSAALGRSNVRAYSKAITALTAAVLALRNRKASDSREGPPLGLVVWVTERSVVRAVAPSSVAECLKCWRRTAVQAAQSIVGAGPLDARSSSETPHTLREDVVRLLTCGVFTLLATCTRLDKKKDVHGQLAAVLPSSRRHVLLDGLLAP